MLAPNPGTRCQKFSRTLVTFVLDPEEITGDQAYTKVGFLSYSFRLAPGV